MERFTVVYLPDGEAVYEYGLKYGVYDTARGKVISKWATEQAAQESAARRNGWECAAERHQQPQ